MKNYGNIADIRQEYTKSGLRENELPDDPLLLFSQWLQEAIDAKVDEPTAVIVGTVSVSYTHLDVYKRQTLQTLCNITNRTVFQNLP